LRVSGILYVIKKKFHIKPKINILDIHILVYKFVLIETIK